MFKKLSFRFWKLLGRQMTPDLFFSMFQTLPSKGWRIQKGPFLPFGEIRFRSSDPTDGHLYCPIEALARELTGYPWRWNFTALPVVPGRALVLSEEFIWKVSKVSDEAGPFLDDGEREIRQRILTSFSLVHP